MKLNPTISAVLCSVMSQLFLHIEAKIDHDGAGFPLIWWCISRPKNHLDFRLELDIEYYFNSFHRFEAGIFCGEHPCTRKVWKRT